METFEILFIIINTFFCGLSIFIFYKAKQLLNKTKLVNLDLQKEIEFFKKNGKEKEETNDLIINHNLLDTFKSIPDFNKLTSKNEMYLSNLQSVVFFIKENKNNPKIFNNFDIFNSAENIGICWCKKPEDVFKDIMIISKYYNKEEV